MTRRNDIYLGRIRRTAKILRDRKIDAIFLSNLSNIYYLSGFRGSNAFCLLTGKGLTLFTDFRYGEAAKRAAEFFAVEIYNDSFIPSLQKKIKTRKIKRLGFESASIHYSQYKYLSGNLKGVKLVPVDSAVEQLRTIKDGSEILSIGKAAGIIDGVVKKIPGMIKQGISEKELAGEIDYCMRNLGAEKTSFDSIVAFGRSSSRPHAELTEKKLRKGEEILIDIGCVRDGYSSDLTRTFFLNTISRKQRKVYEAVLEAQRLALALIKPGAAIKDIDAAARDHIKAEGFGRFFGHALGHGIGIDVHEFPRISPRSDQKLEVGMVFTVEPGIYLPGRGGVRIEDIVVVTKTGYDIITLSPRSVEEMIV
ncbi:M24 family metallopeptidase [Candidatus Auribacterota bacterium]